jgi:hypothetical protein
LFRFGQWVVGLDSCSYVHLIDGHANDAKFWKDWGKAPLVTYAELEAQLPTKQASAAEVQKLVSDVRLCLRGEGAQCVSAGTFASASRALWIYAKFVSEPARNWRTWCVNLMLLDLVERRLLTWPDFFRLHPMRGGSFAHQSSNAAHNNAQVVQAESHIVLFWLYQFWPYQEPHPVLETAHSAKPVTATAESAASASAAASASVSLAPSASPSAAASSSVPLAGPAPAVSLPCGRLILLEQLETFCRRRILRLLSKRSHDITRWDELSDWVDEEEKEEFNVTFSLRPWLQRSPHTPHRVADAPRFAEPSVDQKHRELADLYQTAFRQQDQLYAIDQLEGLLESEAEAAAFASDGHSSLQQSNSQSSQLQALAKTRAGVLAEFRRVQITATLCCLSAGCCSLAEVTQEWKIFTWTSALRTHALEQLTRHLLTGTGEIARHMEALVQQTNKLLDELPH